MSPGLLLPLQPLLADQTLQIKRRRICVRALRPQLSRQLTRRAQNGVGLRVVADDREDRCVEVRRGVDHG